MTDTFTASSLHDCCKVFISEIPSWMEDELLKRIFTACGSLKFFKRVRDAEGHRLSFGIAEYVTLNDVSSAYHTLSSFNLPPKNQPLKITIDKRDAPVIHSSSLDPSLVEKLSTQLEEILSGKYSQDIEVDVITDTTSSELFGTAGGRVTEKVAAVVSQEVNEFRRSQAVRDVHETEKDRLKSEALKQERIEEVQAISEALGVPSSVESPQPEPNYLKVKEIPKVSHENLEKISRKLLQSFPVVEKSSTRDEYNLSLNQSMVRFLLDYEQEQSIILNQLSTVKRFPDILAPPDVVDSILGPWGTFRMRQIAKERAEDWNYIQKLEEEKRRISKEEVRKEEKELKIATFPTPVQSKVIEVPEFEIHVEPLVEEQPPSLPPSEPPRVSQESTEDSFEITLELEEEPVGPQTQPPSEPPSPPADPKILARKLAEELPFEKNELFRTFPNNSTLLLPKIRQNVHQWMLIKLSDLMGEDPLEIADIVSDITSMVVDGAKPSDLIGDLIDLLEKDTEIFVQKLWRLVLLQCKLAENNLL
ncbi:hypothetical protein RCL1_004287 [Eukaryota sp. TZLM3-RCL]